MSPRADRRAWHPDRRPQRVTVRLTTRERIALDERVVSEGSGEAAVIRAALAAYLKIGEIR